MRVRWRGLELPSRVSKDETISTDTYGRFVIEPFERGFGTTVGNSLRRILLSSLEGAAVVSAKISGAAHEFASLDGVHEDVADIILNIKSIIIALEGDGPTTLRYSRSEKGEVRAGDCEADPSVEIINPEQVIATLTGDIAFEIELVVEKGRGYVMAAERGDEETIADVVEVGVIPIDAVYSPVTRVRYKTEDTRVGQRVNYDRLVLEIWTKGTVTPDMAMVEAAKILRKHLNPFVQYSELGDQVTVDLGESGGDGGLDDDLIAKLNMNVSELDLSVRAGNCLESAKIALVGELAKMTEADLLKVRSFGRTSLREVKRKLSDLGLSLGMDLGVYDEHLAVSDESDEQPANVE